MNKIVYRKGDLFEGIKYFEGTIIIPHVVNIKNKMGSGFVVPLVERFPMVKEEYHRENGMYDLGDVQVIEPPFSNVVICNMFAQTLGGKRPLFYNALAKCMDQVEEEARIRKATIVAPKFGAGLAGGNWSFIEALIEDCWLRCNIKVYIYEL